MNTDIHQAYVSFRPIVTTDSGSVTGPSRTRSGVEHLVKAALVLFERGFVVFSLLVGVGAIAAFVPYENPFDVSAGSPILRRIWMVNYLITLLLVAPRWKKVVLLIMRDPLLILFMAFVVMSISWSDTPEIAMRRTLALLGTTLFGAYIAARFSISEQLRLVAATCTIALLLSAATVMIMPESGIMTEGVYQGAWRGSFSHKNPLARTMVLAVLVYALIPTRTLVGQLGRWVTIIGAIVLTAMARSATAILALIALGLFYRFVQLHRWTGRARFAAFAIGGAIAISVAVLVADNLGTIFAWFGRDISMTGRTFLWSSVIEMIEERPLLGYGYSSFWLGAGSAAGTVWQAVGWDPGHAHNGFLDLTVDLGLVGLFLFLLHYCLSLFRAAELSRVVADGTGLWPIMYLGYMLIYNQTESSIIKQNHSFWILYVAVVLSLRVYAIRASRDSVRERSVPVVAGSSR